MSRPPTFDLTRACWVLGAGASFDCFGEGLTGVNLTRNLIEIQSVEEELLKYLESLIGAELLSCESVAEALGPKLEVTVDTVRGLADSGDQARSGPAQTALATLVWEVSRSVSFYISLASFMGHFEKFGLPQNYGGLVAFLSLAPESSVITLNYDTLLDHTFGQAHNLPDTVPTLKQWRGWQALLDSVLEGVPIRLPSQGGIYVKLHGSLFLYSCMAPFCADYRRPFISQREWLEGGNRHTHSLTHHVDCPSCGSKASHLILPPGRNKSCAENEFYQGMNTAAEWALTRAETWIILGYSCPDYDIDMIDLLARAASQPPASGNRREVLIVDPDAGAIADRITRLLRERLGSGHYLRDFLAARETFSSFMTKITQMAGEPLL